MSKVGREILEQLGRAVTSKPVAVVVCLDSEKLYNERTKYSVYGSLYKQGFLNTAHVGEYIIATAEFVPHSLLEELYATVACGEEWSIAQDKLEEFYEVVEAEEIY